MKKKWELLEHYSTRNPQTFRQYDAFTKVPPGGGPVLGCVDPEGDALFAGFTDELMRGANVRVLVSKGTSQADGLRTLKKIRKWIRQDVWNEWPDGIQENDKPF